MEAIKQQIDKLQDELNEIHAKGSMTAADIERRDQINWEMMKLEGELQSQHQIEQNHEQRVQEAKDEFSAYIQASLDDDGITPEEIFIGEKQRQLYTIKSSQAFNALASKLSSQLSGAEEREIQLQRQNDEMQGRIKALEEELQSEKTKSAKFEFERDEAHKTRTNAANALGEAEKEIARLNGQIDDMRKEAAVGARNAYKVYDAEEQQRQIEDLVKEVKESRIKVINMRPAEFDFKRETWHAEDALTGEMYTFNHLEKGKYTVLNENEVQQFRLEQAQKTAIIADIPLVAPALPDVTQDQFRGGDGDILQPSVLSPNGNGTAANTMGGSDDETVSLTARIEALEADVKALKLRNGMVA